MQTNFTAEQLQDSNIAESEKILRKCVHCGFCTATCPTFVLLGDELDSPRGRIYLIKDLLENDRPVDGKFVKHIDRCLSCLSCMTTCPSGVNYMHLVDHARSHIEKNYKRPLMDKLIRHLLAMILPYPKRFRIAMWTGVIFKPLAGLIPPMGKSLRQISAMLNLVSIPDRNGLDQTGLIESGCKSVTKKGRVALLSGCVQPVLNKAINAATVRLVNRVGFDIVIPAGVGCCGALVQHLGMDEEAIQSAKNNVDAWWREINDKGLDAIIITASGCGTTIKDYGFMLRDEPNYAEKAAKISELTVDITEFLHKIDLVESVNPDNQIRVAYHSACSMQHGQKITTVPKILLSQAGFEVEDIPEGHICCGSAGTYNIVQPEIATKLRKRKIENIMKTSAEIVATGNIGCMTQLKKGLNVPIVHTVELLDWAMGGPMPKPLEVNGRFKSSTPMNKPN